MKINIISCSGDIVSSMKISDKVYSKKYNEALVHQVICSYMLSSRQGTSSQKTRAEVSGGGAKPWRQKGTGRARAGSIRSPIWKSGGVTFASKTRNYHQKVNKKMYSSAMKCILSEILRDGRMSSVNEITIDKPRVKDFLQKLKSFPLKKTAILVDDDELTNNLTLSSRNIPSLTICPVSRINPIVLIDASKIIITEKAIKTIEEVLL